MDLQNIESMLTQGSGVFLLLPELLIVIAIAALILVGIVVEGRNAAASLGLAALGATLAAFVFTCTQFSATETSISVFRDQIVVDRLSLFFKALALGATAIVIVMSLIYPPLQKYTRVEYYAVLLTATLGVMLVAGSTNWLMLYLGLETLSMASYVTAGYLKNDARSAEGSIKYLIYGAVSSAFLLFGISYIFGLTGTLQVDAALGAPKDLMMQIALLLVFVGIAFKISAFPLHFWTPDVYQGAPTPITAYLAVASKAGGFVAALRIFFPGVISGVDGVLGTLGWEPVFWVASIFTMTVGNLAALRQTSLKRLLAYSSIAHAGYLLMALTVPGAAAIEALLFYLVAYLVMNLGAFMVVLYLESITGTDEVGAYQGLVRVKPMAVVVMAILLFSLTGLPPTFGFVGKVLVFGAVMQAAHSNADLAMFYYTLALVGAVNTAISLYYYAGVLRIMVLQQGDTSTASHKSMSADLPGGYGMAARSSIAVFGFATIWFGLFWGPLREVIDSIITS